MAREIFFFTLVVRGYVLKVTSSPQSDLDNNYNDSAPEIKF